MSERRTTTMTGVDPDHHHDSSTQTHYQHQAMITVDEFSRKRKPGIPNYHQAEEAEDEHQPIPKKPKTLRLFGVDIPIDHLLTTSQQDQGMISIDETSRKRKTRSPNYHQEEEAAEDEHQPIPKKPKTLRLFGVDIPIDHLLTSSQQDQGMISIDETSRSPNYHKEEEGDCPKILRLFGVDIPIDHLLTTCTTSSQQTQNPNIQEEEEEETAAAPTPHNPNQEEEEEETTAAPTPHNPNIQEEEEEETAAAPTPHNPNQEEEEEAPAPMPHTPDQEEEAPAPIPALQPRIILGRNPVLLFEKVLTTSDVARGQNRLLITRNGMLMAALTEEEGRKVEEDFLRVPTRDANGVEYEMQLTRWATSGAIVLNHKWGKLVQANGLQRGNKLQGWGYRVVDQFHLLLNITTN